MRNCHAIIGLFQKDGFDGLWKEKWDECHGNLFSMRVCVSILWEFHVFNWHLSNFFTVTFKFLSVHFSLFPPSSLCKTVAVYCFSEGLYCNYRSVRSGIHALSPTHLCHSPCWAFVFSTNPTVCTQLYLRAMEDSIHPELFGCREQSSPSVFCSHCFLLNSTQAWNDIGYYHSMYICYAWKTWMAFHFQCDGWTGSCISSDINNM